jgi:hypothetical protein
MEVVNCKASVFATSTVSTYISLWIVLILTASVVTAHEGFEGLPVTFKTCSEDNITDKHTYIGTMLAVSPAMTH